MNALNSAPTSYQETRIVSQNKVLKNTYLLLSATLFFSAVIAGVTAALQLPHPGFIITMVGYFGLLFLTYKFSESSKGLICVFALTGFMGYTLGPIIGAYWAMAPMVVMQSLVGTATIFLGMSFYAMTSKKDFSGLAPVLGVGVLVAFVGGLIGYFFEIPALSLAVSAAFVLLMSGMILYQTNQIVRGGETNYILATVTLFVSIYNLFTSLLHLLGALQGE